MSAAGERVREWVASVGVAPNQFGLPFNETRADALDALALLEAVEEAARENAEKNAVTYRLRNALRRVEEEG